MRWPLLLTLSFCACSFDGSAVGPSGGSNGDGGGVGFSLVWAQSFTEDGTVSPEPVVTNR